MAQKKVSVKFNTPAIRRVVDRVQAVGQDLLRDADTRFGPRVRKGIGPTVARLHQWRETEPAKRTKFKKKVEDEPSE